MRLATAGPAGSIHLSLSVAGQPAPDQAWPPGLGGVLGHTVGKPATTRAFRGCKASTAKHNAGDTCTATYSDGSVATGYANLLPSAGKVTIEPQDVSGQ